MDGEKVELFLRKIKMPNQNKLDNLFMDIAERISKESYAIRKKVGAVLVRDNNIISMGYNGTPKGFDNNCEIETANGLVTNPFVLHAESNVILKLIYSNNPVSANGCTIYVTLSPCIECSKMIIQAGIKRVLFREKYRIDDGVEMLRKAGITVEYFPGEKNA